MRINRQTNPFCTTFHEKRNTITLRNKLLSRACILQSCVLLAAMLFICNVEMNELDNFYYLATLIECTLTKHDICSIFPLIIYFFDTLQRSIYHHPNNLSLTYTILQLLLLFTSIIALYLFICKETQEDIVPNLNRVNIQQSLRWGNECKVDRMCRYPYCPTSHNSRL